jgi:hypothetical protein
LTNIIFAEDIFDVEKIIQKNFNLKESIIFTLDIKAHIALKEKNIFHEFAESYVSKDDRIKIFNVSIKFRDWYKQHPELNQFLLKGINILEVFDLNELQQLLLQRLFKLLIIKRILEKYEPEKIIASTSLKSIVECIPLSKKTILEFFLKPSNNSSFFDKYQINYKIGFFNISFKIKRSTLSKIKKWYEKIATIQNLWFNDYKSSNNILFLEFDPTKYEELFKQLKKFGVNVVLLNKRKSAVWNSKSISIVKNNNCKLINESKLLKNTHEEILINLHSFESKFKKFWNHTDFFNETFIFEQCLFWNVIKDPLIQVYDNRLEEFIQLIILSDKILQSFNFKSIISLFTNGETENTILGLNNNQISHVLLEHGYANFVPNMSRFDIFHMYDKFNDKIAVWGEIQKNYLINSKKIIETKILSVGSPRHDVFFNNKQYVKTKNKKQVLIIPSPIVNYSGLTDTGTFLNYEKLIKKIMLILNQLDVEIIVKLHPTQDDSVKFIKDIFKQIDKNIQIFHTTPILGHLKTADAVIHIEPHGVGLSTAILESLILEIPTLNVVIKNEIFEFDCIKEKAILSLSDSDNLEKPISDLLNDTNVRNELIKNSKKHISKYMINPGVASESFARKLSS